jgi:hypothetical protein
MQEQDKDRNGFGTSSHLARAESACKPLVMGKPEEAFREVAQVNARYYVERPCVELCKYQSVYRSLHCNVELSPYLGVAQGCLMIGHSVYQLSSRRRRRLVSLCLQSSNKVVMPQLPCVETAPGTAAYLALIGAACVTGRSRLNIVAAVVRRPVGG